MNIETNSIIAVVDGNGDHRAHTCGVLQRAGFHTWSAPSAEDFYVGLLSTRVDLVISELALPGKQGFHLVRRLAGQGIPSIILASSRGIESRIAGLKAGALQYFVKPVDMREVVAGVSSILNQVKHAKIPNPILNQREMPSWRLNPHTNCLIAPNLGMVPLTRNELALIDCLLSANTEVV
ncbi:MAG: response regulator transcription factor, partial [Pseudomonadales bacterium]